MSARPPSTEAILARHWLSHAGESAEEAARHLHLDPLLIANAAERLQVHGGLAPRDLIRFLREHPIRFSLATRLSHPDASQWLSGTHHAFLLSGEDAAVIDGWSIVPHRHLIYVHASELAEIVGDAIQTGGRVAEAEPAVLTIRARDPWLSADNGGLVERGQRVMDYVESKNVQFLLQMRERMPEGLP